MTKILKTELFAQFRHDKFYDRTKFIFQGQMLCELLILWYSHICSSSYLGK